MGLKTPEPQQLVQRAPEPESEFEEDEEQAPTPRLNDQ